MCRPIRTKKRSDVALPRMADDAGGETDPWGGYFARNGLYDSAGRAAAAEGRLDVLREHVHAHATTAIATKKASASAPSAFATPPMPMPTPLHVAALYANTAAIGLLVHFEDVNARDGRGRAPLHLASSISAFLPRCATAANVSVLLSCGADPNARDDFGNTPLHAAAESDDAAAAVLLVNKGADCEARNRADFTPHALAAAYGHRRSVDVLSELGRGFRNKKQKKK